MEPWNIVRSFIIISSAHPEIYIVHKLSFHPEMVDFGSGQGRSLFATTGVAELRRGLHKDENAGLTR